MKEDFLHYLWKYSLYGNKPLQLTDGTNVEVISCGEHNNDSGPDFFNAKVKIGNTVWAGNIEIHVLASDWHRHKHQNNKAYDNIILHVVAKNDTDIKRENGKLIPALELISPKGVYEQYLYLMQSKSWVACETFIKKINEFIIIDWKQALLIERLQEKSEIIEERFIANNKNWEEAFYQTLAANFGFKTNSLPFEMLAKSVPVNYLGKHKDNLLLIEAMLFGQSGLLPKTPKEPYTIQLLKDYEHLKNKFNLQPMSGHLWKFSKLRPSNFPTVRLAQFAALIHNSNALMSKIIEAENFSEVKKYFDVEASGYWQNHYVFEKTSAHRNKKFGDTAFQNIVINTIAPFFALYGSLKNNPHYTQKALNWLTQLKPEQNSITKHWSELGLNVKNAFDSQSLIQLKNSYCNKKKCLNCRIGNQVIKHNFE